MLDEATAVVPGKGAAGYQVGMSIDVVLAEDARHFESRAVVDDRGRASGTLRYNSADVNLWVSHRHIIQIGVHGAYRGRLRDTVALGMTVDDIERLIGPCAEDGEDDLCINGIDRFVFQIGWQLDIAASDVDLTLRALRFAPITWMFVYQMSSHG